MMLRNNQDYIHILRGLDNVGAIQDIPFYAWLIQFVNSGTHIHTGLARWSAQTTRLSVAVESATTSTRNTV